MVLNQISVRSKLERAPRLVRRVKVGTGELPPRTHEFPQGIRREEPLLSS